MSDEDFQKFATEMEERYLELQAGAIQQGIEIAILREMLVSGSSEPEKAARQARIDAARKTGIEEFLRTLADHTPTLASRLRERLASLLDGTTPP